MLEQAGHPVAGRIAFNSLRMRRFTLMLKTESRNIGPAN